MNLQSRTSPGIDKMVWGECPNFFGPFQYFQNSLVLRQIKELVKEKSSILDLGCGSGGLLHRLNSNNYDVMGIDSSSKFISHIKKTHPHLVSKVSIQDACNLAFEDGTFDCVVSTEVLEHILDDQKVVDEVHRVLVDSGLFIITVPINKTKWDFTDEWAGHYRRYSFEDLQELLEKFTCLRILYWGFPLGELWYKCVTKPLIRGFLSVSFLNAGVNRKYRVLNALFSNAFYFDLLFSRYKKGRNILIIAKK